MVPVNLLVVRGEGDSINTLHNSSGWGGRGIMTRVNGLWQSGMRDREGRGESLKKSLLVFPKIREKLNIRCDSQTCETQGQRRTYKHLESAFLGGGE